MPSSSPWPSSSPSSSIPILGARNVFYLEVIFQIAVFSALALGLNIVVGFSGLLNFGYMAFYAVGAYLWGFFGSQQPYLLQHHGHHEVPEHALLHGAGLVLPLHLPGRHRGGGASASSSGLPVLRVRGDYLAVITLAFGEIVRQLANNLDKPSTSPTAPRASRPIQRPTMPKGVLNALQHHLRARSSATGSRRTRPTTSCST